MRMFMMGLRLSIFALGEEMYVAILEDLKSAEKIHLSGILYYRRR